MKILALMNKPGGVDYHRLIKPLMRLHIDEGVDVNKAQDIDDKGIPDLTPYDLVTFNRYLYKQHYDVLEYLAKHNIPYVIDIDDYWKLPKYHPAFEYYRKNKLPRAIEDAIRYSSGVTTSTEPLAAYIRQLHPRVCILPNVLDTTDEQWNWPQKESERLRVGWLAGGTHTNDASIIGESISIALKDVDFDFVYCGFDPKSQVNLSILSRLNNNERNMKIFAMRGRSPDEYGKMIADLDVLVAPLENTKYNNCKSDIKILEAAAYSKPIICSNVLPYSEHKDNPGVILVDNLTNNWADILRQVGSMSKSQLAEIGKANNKYCETWDMETVNKKRLSFYEQCIKSSTHVRG